MRREIIAGVVAGFITAATIGAITLITQSAGSGGLVKLLGGVTQEDLDELGNRLDRDDIEILNAVTDLGKRLDEDDMAIINKLEELESRLPE